MALIFACYNCPLVSSVYISIEGEKFLKQSAKLHTPVNITESSTYYNTHLLKWATVNNSS